MTRLLIADASPAIRKVGAAILGDLGFTVSEVESCLEALSRCNAELPDIVIIDSQLDGAIELMAALRLLPGGGRLQIFCTLAKTDLRTLMAMRHAGADDVLLKPFDRKVLASVFAHRRQVA